MIGRISATRMELLRARKRLALARRGHYLLKGKQDELLRRFMTLLEEYLPAREELESLFAELLEKVADAAAETSPEEAATAAWPLPPRIAVKKRSRRILNLGVPVRKPLPYRRSPAYSAFQLPGTFDEAVEGWKDLVPALLEGADREETLQLLADEIEKTRRRVNALEFRLIPDLEQGIRLISLKLAEAELGNLSRLMRIKEIVRAR